MTKWKQSMQKKSSNKKTVVVTFLQQMGVGHLSRLPWGNVEMEICESLTFVRTLKNKVMCKNFCCVYIPLVSIFNDVPQPYQICLTLRFLGRFYRRGFLGGGPEDPPPAVWYSR